VVEEDERIDGGEVEAGEGATDFETFALERARRVEDVDDGPYTLSSNAQV